MKMPNEKAIADISYKGMYVIDELTNNTNPRLAAEAVRDAFGLAGQFYYHRGLRTVNAVCAARTGENEYSFFSSGVNRNTALALVHGYRSRREMVRAGYVNAQSKLDAIEFFGPFVLSILPRNADVRLYGHSGGGVLVESLGIYLKEVGRPEPLSIITYGAPKPFLVGSAAQIVGGERRRWMLERDPVPGFPFFIRRDGSWSRFVQSTIATQGVGSDFPLDSIRHGAGGVILYQEGGATRASDATSATEADFENFLSWASGRETLPGRQHSTKFYLEALRRRAMKSDRGEDISLSSRLSSALPVEYAAPENVPMWGKIPSYGTVLNQRSGELTVPESLQVVPSVRKVKEMAQSKIVSNMRFGVVNITGTFCVTFQGLVVATTTRPSQARTIARAGNRLCRTLGLATTIDANLWDDAWSEFGGKASTPGNGVTPAQAWQ